MGVAESRHEAWPVENRFPAQAALPHTDLAQDRYGSWSCDTARVISDVCWPFQVTYRFTSDRDISGAFEPREMVFGSSGNSVGSTKSYARCCPTITQHTPLQKLQ